MVNLTPTKFHGPALGIDTPEEARHEPIVHWLAFKNPFFSPASLPPAASRIRVQITCVWSQVEQVELWSAAMIYTCIKFLRCGTTGRTLSVIRLPELFSRDTGSLLFAHAACLIRGLYWISFGQCICHFYSVMVGEFWRGLAAQAEGYWFSSEGVKFQQWLRDTLHDTDFLGIVWVMRIWWPLEM